MLRKTSLLASALAVAALAPAAAHAAGAKLGGQPTMHAIDAHHATLEFAADKLPRTKSGAVDARIQFAGGQRVSGLKPVGRHGYDVRYQATVTSKSGLCTFSSSRSQARQLTSRKGRFSRRTR